MAAMWAPPGRAPTSALKLRPVLAVGSAVCDGVWRLFPATPAVAACAGLPVVFELEADILPTWASAGVGLLDVLAVVLAVLVPAFLAVKVGSALAVPAALEVAAPLELAADLLVPA